MVNSSAKYTPLHNGESESGEKTPMAMPRRSTVLTFLAYLGLWAGVLAIGFLSGLHWARLPVSSNIELRSIPQVFQYNRSFGEPPSEYTDGLWASLFPEQGGFFKHPTLAPKRSAFSVFHQLHCLDGIRQGYWAVFDAAKRAEGFDEDELPMMSSPPHIRHCIDLLRRTLMCNPDTTIEIKDESVGGVKGFGTEHQCKDWSQLVAWTSEWETYQQEPRTKIEGTNKHKGHGSHGSHA